MLPHTGVHFSICLRRASSVVANPPFSDKRWSTGLDPANDPYQRFQPFGTPPAKQGDYAYLLHIVRSLKSTGKGAASYRMACCFGATPRPTSAAPWCAI